MQALTPLTIGRNRFAAALLGSFWGLGHSTGQLLIGLGFALLKEQFTELVPLLTKWAGKIVALTLIAIGAFGIKECYFEGEGGEEHGDEEKIREITGVKEGKVRSASFTAEILVSLPQKKIVFIISTNVFCINAS